MGRVYAAESRYTVIKMPGPCLALPCRSPEAPKSGSSQNPPSRPSPDRRPQSKHSAARLRGAVLCRNSFTWGVSKQASKQASCEKHTGYCTRHSPAKKKKSPFPRPRRSSPACCCPILRCHAAYIRPVTKKNHNDSSRMHAPDSPGCRTRGGAPGRSRWERTTAAAAADPLLLGGASGIQDRQKVSVCLSTPPKRHRQGQPVSQLMRLPPPGFT
ncbi:hypothetical protein F4780DRAFT_201734 [Xylariomycetidae sp. FL0641]|nr:hypothetical protein F4780DRAFT_201734 [Xylariomycetidae sp. FL0641]